MSGRKSFWEVFKSPAGGGLQPVLSNDGGAVSEVWGLDPATMQWEAMPRLMRARSGNACCAVRGALVVLGGWAHALG